MVPDIQGHRGARGLLPENTVAGFLRALELGVTTLELDVVVTADGALVATHEPWMSSEYVSHPDGRPVRPDEEASLNIFRMTYDEVRSYDCGSRGHPRFPRQERRPSVKPLLEEVIRECEAYRTSRGLGAFDYSIETKLTPDGDGVHHPPPERFARLLYDLLVEARVLSRSIIQSFDVRSLQVASRLDPQWRTALLIDRDRDAGLAANLRALGFIPSIYSPDFRLVNERMVDQVHEAGMRLIPWTVNDAASMRALDALGVDGIITDYPDVAIRTLWP